MCPKNISEQRSEEALFFVSYGVPLPAVPGCPAHTQSQLRDTEDPWIRSRRNHDESYGVSGMNPVINHHRGTGGRKLDTKMFMMVTMVMIPDGHNGPLGPLAPLEEEDEKKKKKCKEDDDLNSWWANWLVDDADNEGDDGDDSDDGDVMMVMMMMMMMDGGWWMTGDGRWTMDEGW